MNAIRQAALFEHRFWLQILGDHARFILNALSPAEKEEIAAARSFIVLFDSLLCVARELPPDGRLDELAARAAEAAGQLRAFKLDLLRRHICEEIRLGLGPTFLNHMVNELEEYLLILDALLAGDPPPLCHPIHHHHLWVPDAEGHAGTIACSLDLAEKELKHCSETFAQTFRELFLKTHEFEGYLRSGIGEFPALGRLNCQVEREILAFSAFLAEIRALITTNQALGTLLPLVPDHMLREECYFLHKLAQAAGTKHPDCDPTRPRRED